MGSPEPDHDRLWTLPEDPWETVDSIAAPAAVAIGTAALVILAGGGAFWVCVPAALIAAAMCARQLTAALAGGAVVVAAAAAAAAASGNPPPAALAALVPAASVVTFLALRRRLEHERDELRASAQTDPLTGIANRRLLRGRIEYEIARHARARRSFALVMLDLDGFKPINDRFGHAAGDKLLREVAATLTLALREQDTVARIGGDEFCVLAPETGLAGAQRLLARVAAAVTGVRTRPDPLTASGGLAIFPADGTAAGALLAAADQRLLAAKRAKSVPEKRAA